MRSLRLGGERSSPLQKKVDKKTYNNKNVAKKEKKRRQQCKSF